MTAPHDTTTGTYWKSPAACAGLREDPPLPGVSRRGFLEAAGFAASLAAIGGCQPPTTVVPAVANETDNVRPGRIRSFATTCGGCPAACGMLATVRDGRPLKMEGMPEHPLSRGGLCAVGQAQVMELYDQERLRGPLVAGKAATWSDADAQIAAALAKLPANGAVRVVTASTSSPTLRRAIAAFLKRFPDGRHIEIDPASISAILDAHAATHGVRRLPHHRFERARHRVVRSGFLGHVDLACRVCGCLEDGASLAESRGRERARRRHSTCEH